MAEFDNPVITALVRQLGADWVFAQVSVRRSGASWELRHVADTARSAGELRSTSIDQLRALAQNTSNGSFPPLKSAPDLATGWRACASSETDLADALDQLYPGAVADWFALKFGSAQPTHYRDYTARQTGMYRVTAMLSDEQAAKVIRAACSSQFCLKQRLWTVDGLPTDPEGDGRSMIPCLEPCAMLLEFARKAGRVEQEESCAAQVAPSDVESLKQCIQASLGRAMEEGKIGDVGSPMNPRRLVLLLEKLAAIERPSADSDAD